jgi:hypothetical protein
MQPSERGATLSERVGREPAWWTAVARSLRLLVSVPVLHLRKVAGGDMVVAYIDSFERVWAGA